ncbi:daptide biosynthesis intramembrane metalloprotease [Paenibacillus sp. B01]|uniref:daptide biosynthesis intramembrane metalloprotease n=1 Tax=Paenibacillus sp. B01 TaxID=2660554 RepID=UPI00129AD8BD|nr:daptide biosynthesis intramembrane metalloprotease [Paenibacillus sp. B01]QGG54423.1 hypothetical protein GE073_01605 [Paenibacillus sp. B01]
MSTASLAFDIHEIENNLFLVQHKSSRKFIRMGPRETEYLQFLAAVPAAAADPPQGEAAAQAQAAPAYAGSLTEEERAYLAAKFGEWGFLDPALPEEEAAGARKWRFNWRIDDLTTIKFFSVDPDAWLDRRLPLIRLLLHPAAIAAYGLVMLGAFALLLSQPQLTVGLDPYGLGWGQYAAIYAMIVLTTVIHELGHGMTCKYYGGRVKQMGAMLFYFSPAMFCDVSDTYTFRRRRHKLAVLAAGVFSQWLLSSLAILAYGALQAAGAQPSELLLYYAFANLGMSVLNLLPLVKLDGYWMLSHGLGIANLRAKAFRSLWSLLRLTKFRGEAAQSGASRRERAILLAYGAAATAFTPCFWLWGILQVQQRLQAWIGAFSFLVTACIAVVMLYHMGKFFRTMRQPA